MTIQTAMHDGSSVAGTRADRSRYDPRIDFFRGLALMFIFINHIPYNAMAVFTSRSTGLSDSAEIFIFLAGYAAALAYAKLAPAGFPPMALKASKRALTILIWHLGLMILAFSTAYIFNNHLGWQMGYHIYLEKIAAEPLTVLLAAPFLSFQAPLLDILPLYVLLVLAIPPMIWMVSRNPVTLLAVSALIWMAAARMYPLVPTVTYDVYWGFNPFCWQFLFAIGLTCGWYGRSGNLPIATPETRPMLDIACVIFKLFNIGALIVIQHPEWQGAWPDAFRGAFTGLNKQCIDIWRIADILATVYLVARVLPKTAGWLASVPAQLFIYAGRSTLPLFCLSIMLSLFAKVIVEAYEWSLAADVAVSLTGIAILLAGGYLLALRGKPVPVAKLEPQNGTLAS